MRNLTALLAVTLLLSACTSSNPTSQSSPTGSPSASPSPSPTPTLSTPSPPLATPSGPSANNNAFRFTKVAGGLGDPVYVTGAGDGSGRLFIVEQVGRIRIVKDGVLLPTPFLDIHSLVASGGERGLLSVAFHPDFKTNGVFIVDYTRASANVGDTRHRTLPSGPARRRR